MASDIVAMQQQQLYVGKSDRDKHGMDLRETHQSDGVGRGKDCMWELPKVGRQKSERGPTRTV